MKHIGKIVALGAVIAASASPAFATPISISLASYGSVANGVSDPSEIGSLANGAMEYQGFSASSSTPVNPSGTPISEAYNLAPAGVWANPLGNTDSSAYTIAPASGPDSTWVGAFSTAGPNGTPPAAGYYTFSTDITVTASGVYTGTLDVMADDTTEVLLNGVLIPGLGFGSIPPDTHCAGGVPNCAGEDNVAVSLDLLAGSNNVLTFVVDQTAQGNGGNASSGVDFDGTLTLTPEPSSLMLLGTGLVGAAGMFFRRRVVTE
jgi:hypothetical protein